MVTIATVVVVLGIVWFEAFDWNCPQHITPRYTAKEPALLQRMADT